MDIVDSIDWHPRAGRAIMASVSLGAWMSAALDDPAVCDAMKADIREWFSAGEPMEILASALAAKHRQCIEAAAEIEALRAALAARDAEISRAVECLVYSAGTTTDPHTARQIVTVYTRLGFSHDTGLYRKDAE